MKLWQWWAKKNIGAILIIEDTVLKGVLSEGIMLEKLFWKLNLQRKLLAIMETDVVTVSPSDNLEYCMELMSTKRNDTCLF
jgi:CBS domain-containing protein